MEKPFVKAHETEAQSFMQKCPKLLHVCGKLLLTKTSVKAHEREAQNFMQKCPKLLYVR